MKNLSKMFLLLIILKCNLYSQIYRANQEVDLSYLQDTLQQLRNEMNNKTDSWVKIGSGHNKLYLNITNTDGVSMLTGAGLRENRNMYKKGMQIKIVTPSGIEHKSTIERIGYNTKPLSTWDTIFTSTPLGEISTAQGDTNKIYLFVTLLDNANTNHSHIQGDTEEWLPVFLEQVSVTYSRLNNNLGVIVIPTNDKYKVGRVINLETSTHNFISGIREIKKGLVMDTIILDRNTNTTGGGLAKIYLKLINDWILVNKEFDSIIIVHIDSVTDRITGSGLSQNRNFYKAGSSIKVAITSSEYMSKIKRIGYNLNGIWDTLYIETINRSNVSNITAKLYLPLNTYDISNKLFELERSINKNDYDNGWTKLQGYFSSSGTAPRLIVNSNDLHKVTQYAPIKIVEGMLGTTLYYMVDSMRWNYTSPGMTYWSYDLAGYSYDLLSNILTFSNVYVGNPEKLLTFTFDLTMPFVNLNINSETHNFLYQQRGIRFIWQGPPATLVRWGTHFANSGTFYFRPTVNGINVAASGRVVSSTPYTGGWNYSLQGYGLDPSNVISVAKVNYGDIIDGVFYGVTSSNISSLDSGTLSFKFFFVID